MADSADANNEILAAVAKLGVVILNVLLVQAVGYLCFMPSGKEKTSLMQPAVIGSLGAFCGLVSLPAILFRAVASLNFSTVDFSVLLALFVGKSCLALCSFALGMITADDSVPRMQMLTAGCYTVLTTNSDDLGLGLPVLGAIFPPQLVNMCFVLNALQSMIINPMIFLMLGVGAAQRDAPTDGTPPASTSEILRSVIRGLSKNHIVLSVVFGLLYNILFGGLNGAELPFYLDNLCKYFGGAFGPMVLFMGGAANVGAFSKLAELQSAIMPIGTVLLKSFLLPAVVLCVVSMLGGSREILDFAFAFSTLPVAASTLVFANPYKPNAQLRSLLNSGLALGKLIGFPLIFLSAAIFKTRKVHDIVIIEGYMAHTLQSICAVCLLLLLTSAIYYKPWRTPPLRLIYHFSFFTLGYCIISLVAWYTHTAKAHTHIQCPLPSVCALSALSMPLTAAAHCVCVCVCVCCRYTPQETLYEFIAVSTFRFASEASLILAAFIRIFEAQCMLKALHKANKDAEVLKTTATTAASLHPTLPARSGSGPLAGTVSNLVEAARKGVGLGGGKVLNVDLEAPLMDAATAVRQVSGKRSGEKIFAQRWGVHFLLAAFLGLCCTLPFAFLYTLSGERRFR